MTPAPQAKRLDARILSKADLDRLSSVAWNYARESTVVQVRDYLQDVASLRGHIDALESEAAAREEQVWELVEAVKTVMPWWDNPPFVLEKNPNLARVVSALAALTNASPPACEGERVDVEKLAREIVKETDLRASYLTSLWAYDKTVTILRRHFPPAAPKPAAGGEKPAQALPADDGERVDHWLAIHEILCTNYSSRWGGQHAAVAESIAKLLAAQSAELDALRAKIESQERQLGDNANAFARIKGIAWAAWMDWDEEQPIDAAIAAKDDKP